MKYYLIVAKGRKKGAPAPSSKGLPVPIDADLYLIGSGRVCQMRTNHERVGEQHCALVRRQNKIFIRDLNRGEPTFVNGAPIPAGEEWPLHGGDLIEFGPFALNIQFHESTLDWRNVEDWSTKNLDLDGGRKITAIDQLESATAEAKQTEDAAASASVIIDRLRARNGIVSGRIRISQEDGMSIVRVLNIHLVDDAELAMLKKELHDNLNLTFLKILLDMKDVQRMSVAGVKMLDDFVEWLVQNGSRMAICRLRPDLLQMLRTFPAIDMLSHFRDKQQALTANW